MVHEAYHRDFKESIDFSGHPSLSRTPSMYEIYGSAIPNSLYSPAPTLYSTDECMTPDSIDYDFNSSFDQNLQRLNRSHSFYSTQDTGIHNTCASMDRTAPTSGSIEQLEIPIQNMIEAPPTPTSSSEAQCSKHPRSRVRNSARAGKEQSTSKASSNKTAEADLITKAPKKRKPASRSKSEKPKIPELTRPLSELTRDYTDLPIKDIESWVHRSIEDRRLEVEIRKGYVPRPMNSFMLYRSAFAERTKIWCLQNNHQVVSSVSGASWPLEPAYIREKYNELAKIERINHQIAHPGYKFSPSKNQLPPRRVRKTASCTDVEDESDEFSKDIDKLAEQIAKPVPPPVVEKPSKADKTVAMRKSISLDRRFDAPASASASPVEQSAEFMNPYQIQTGAHKSSYEALNPGRPPPNFMSSSNMTGSYYQTIVRPTVSATVGNGMIEDVTIKKTAAPTAQPSFMEREMEDLRQHGLQIHQSQQVRDCDMDQEMYTKPDPTLADLQYPSLLVEPSPTIDMEQYQRILHYQLMQAEALAGNMTAPYTFASPGVPLPAHGISFETDFGGESVGNFVTYNDIPHHQQPQWTGLDEVGNIYGEHGNIFKYDEWLTE